MIEIASAQEPGFKVLAVKGELDLDASPRLLAEIQAALKAASGIKVNLRGVSYVDSSGIAVLIQGYKLALKQKLQFVLREPSPQVITVLELSQLRSFFVFE